MLLGGPPPRSPRSGTSPKGPRSSTGHVQFGKSPQTWPRRTRPRSPEPTAPSGAPGFTQPRRRDSLSRAGPPALSRYVGHLWMGRRPPSPEARGPVPRSSAASRTRRSLASPGTSPGPLTATTGGAVTYARFTGAPLKVHKISNPWRSPSGTLPALRTSHGEVISVPHKIITHLRKEKYNADYDLSARQGADTLAFMSLLEEKLLPVLVHTFWIDTKNYVEVTRKWYAEAMPFPLNFFLPGRMQRQYMERLELLSGEHVPEDEEELEKELYREARECLTLLSQRLGSQKFFFGDAPASLDAFVFSYLALLLQAKLPSGKLQAHLRGLHNLCAYCTHILSLYFPWDGAEVPPPRQTPAGPETEEEPYRRRNQILSVLAGLAAMVGYALLSGIVSIQRATPARAPGTRALGMAEEDEEE
ncbi:metaxin-1 isoform X2 [Piliocolobus tephrosceles]|uniref:metaxin-1 isoform X2 n=1 Tax=Piliocolobus tephrosceles TaxID=591936 RepID=UPI000E6B3EAE|nr:metaxin-1 isoform X2 [Piliocolobus tephrosceles]XP_026309411.1 metaxin-1 isoform X2 [Piliocolobus tephrosceles]XP_026309417.1 metaxin-1 isoform X2 [Piliocolobus tephrosceles]XP_026309420.1 metaxin-1 isoform X2 [Piliocolobus tephrosceles]